MGSVDLLASTSVRKVMISSGNVDSLLLHLETTGTGEDPEVYGTVCHSESVGEQWSGTEGAADISNLPCHIARASTKPNPWCFSQTDC